MRTPAVLIVACASVAACTVVARGAQAQPAARPATPVIYPAKGQSAAQQDKDKYECYDWARRESGFDPVASPQGGMAGPAAAPADATGGMVRGALGGAAVAELGDHDAGRGAAVGALGATLLSRARQAQAAQARQQQARQQQAGPGAQRSVYERAFGACLHARGYTLA